MRTTKWEIAVGWILTLALLPGCGGGSTEQSAQSGVLHAESRVQPIDAVQEPSRIKTLTVAERIRPRVVELREELSTKDLPGSLSGARLVGLARNVAATESAAGMNSYLDWQASPSGGWQAAVSFRVVDAQGLRVGLRVGTLPGGAILRVYDRQRPAQVFEIAGAMVLQRIQVNLDAGDGSDAARTWWTPEIGATEVVLEIELPPGTPLSSLDVSVPVVSEIIENLALPTAEEMGQSKVGESDVCNLDITCYDAYASKSNAVARMLFTQGGSTYVCTGTLLNDRDGSGTPYFLSANHCIASQTAASTLQTDWFYRSPTCNSRVLSSATARRYNGATLLYASSETDTAFMKLVDAPPPGVTFAGWDARTPTMGSSIVGIHHPRGDLQKISFGALQGYTNCAAASGGSFSCSGTTGAYYTVTWSQGTTESGSSGSALWRDGYVIGTLYGGTATCGASSTPAFDIYGRFDRAYADRLKDWLAPVQPAAPRSAVYRFFNTRTGAHFYTISSAERDYVIATYKEFNYEGPVFYAYPAATSGQGPVYRFFNTRTGAHFYTISSAERDYVISAYQDFTYEGPQWHAQTGTGNSSTAIYRFFNTRTGAHFYTINALERDYVMATYKEFNYEGAAYYAWISP